MMKLLKLFYRNNLVQINTLICVHVSYRYFLLKQYRLEIYGNF